MLAIQHVPRHEGARLSPPTDLVSEQTPERPPSLATSRPFFVCIADVVVLQHV